MPEYIQPNVLPRQLRDASHALRENLAHCPETIEVFRVAHNWRSAHIYPMTRVRRELASTVGKLIGKGITAARIKRMSSIRRKLRKEPYSLYSIQDIAGCRAIVETNADVQRIIARYTSGGTRHRIVNNQDLIQNPRVGGYRSHHLVLKFVGDEASKPWNNLSVEMQVRTKLQHAWATAVEAVGLMRRENLKAGEGDQDWLRLFTIMSGEFSAEEGMPLTPGVPSDSRSRRDELTALARKLNAIATLESYNNAISRVGVYQSLHERFVIVQFDYNLRTISIRPFHRVSQGDDAYIKSESGHDDLHTVLIEVTRIDELHDAYPNYFIDVRIFTDRLKALVSTWGRAWTKPS